MKIVVVEPHPDDAFLSLGHHLQTIWKQHELLIITVYADARRTKEAQAYAYAIGAQSLVLGLTESNMADTGKVRRVPELVEALEPLESWDLLYLPLGLQHIDHKRVAASQPIPKTSKLRRYLDTPYQTKQKLAEELQTLSKGLVIESIVFPGQRKWKHIDIYKSQAKFFHYNEGLKTSKLPEITLRSPTLAELRETIS